MATPEQPPPSAIWVISDVAPDGTYIVTVQASDDHAVTLDPPRAVAYARTVMDAAARAEYDAAVYAQLCDIGLSPLAAATAVVDLRADRPPLDDAATVPLRFKPFVTATKKIPALYVELDGKRISQWTTADARGHAMHVLDVLAGVDLDAAYRRYLAGPVGLDDNRARQVVESIGKYRDAGGVR